MLLGLTTVIPGSMHFPLLFRLIRKQVILRFFAPQGQHVAPLGVKFVMDVVDSSMPKFTPSLQG